VRKFSPKEVDHPSVGKECPACRKPFVVGDYTTLVPLGPGGNEKERQRCAAGRPYNAVACEIHWDCADTR